MTPLESKAREEALRITTAFQSFLDSMRENPGKTFTLDLTGLIEKAILRVAAEAVADRDTRTEKSIPIK